MLPIVSILFNPLKLIQLSDDKLSIPSSSDNEGGFRLKYKNSLPMVFSNLSFFNLIQPGGIQIFSNSFSFFKNKKLELLKKSLFMTINLLFLIYKNMTIIWL